MQDGMSGDKSRICHRLSPNIDGAGAGQPKKAVWAYLSMEITPPIPTTPKIHHQHLCMLCPPPSSIPQAVMGPPPPSAEKTDPP